MERCIYVLVADDYGPGRDAVITLLQDFFRSLCVIEVENGKVALEQLRTAQNPIDLVITDIRMPVMDGKEFVKQAREQLGFKGEIIGLSSDDLTEDEYRQLGMDYFVCKLKEGSKGLLAILEKLRFN